MRRLIGTFVLLSGAVVAVWLSAGPGDVTPNRVIACEAQATPSLRARALDAGIRLARQFQIETGAYRYISCVDRPNPDGGPVLDGGCTVNFVLSKELGDDVRIKDFDECDVTACAAAPVLCSQAKFDSAIPFRLAQPRCVRRKADAGLGTCVLLDGGEPDGYPCRDGCNVFRAARYLDPTAVGCERVACSVPAGSSALRELDPEAE